MLQRSLTSGAALSCAPYCTGVPSVQCPRQSPQCSSQCSTAKCVPQTVHALCLAGRSQALQTFPWRILDASAHTPSPSTLRHWRAITHRKHCPNTAVCHSAQMSAACQMLPGSDSSALSKLPSSSSSAAIWPRNVSTSTSASADAPVAKL